MPCRTPTSSRLGWSLSLWIAVWAFLCPPAHAQTLSTDLDLSQLVLRHWTRSDGLPQNSVSAVETTPDGYLWLATQGGLVRFDGDRFELFDRSRGLSNNEIRALEADDDGSLWIGTYGGGLNRLRDGRLTIYTTEDGLPSDLIRVLHRDRSGRLWIGTIDGGVAVLKGDAFTTYGIEDGLAGNVVLSIAEGPDGAVWLGTNGGLTRFRDGALESFTVRDGLPANIVWSLAHDGSGALWIGTEGGVAVLEGGAITPHDSVNEQCAGPVGALYGDADQSMWIGTMGAGLCRYASGRVERLSVEEGLSDARIRALMQDEEGTLWIGTESGGLNQLRQGKFTHVGTSQGLPDDMVYTVIEDADGGIWIGTKSDGLHRFAAERATRITGLPSEHIYALDVASRGGMWTGHLEGGLCRVTALGTRCYDDADGLPSTNVFAVLEGRDGKVWIGTDLGLAVLDAGRIEPYADIEEAVTVIFEDRTGSIWVGLYGGGLARIDGSRTLRLSAAHGLPEETIFALQQDDAGAIWAASHGGGLCRITGGEVDCLTSDDGLPSDNILQLLLDDHGALWLGTVQGIARVEKADAEAILDARPRADIGSDRNTDTVQSLNARLYTEADGLKSTEVNGGTQPSAWKSRDGRLWFATNHGVAWIDPAAIRTNTVAPPVHVESLDANGEPVALTEDLRLPAGSRDLHIRYTGISFTAPEQVTFEYMLEGYDATWVDAVHRREAYYTNLAPGQYTFRVRAANHDGVWNEEGASIAFYLEPYFYQTWWFAVLCALAALGVAVGAFRLRIRQLKARGRELEEQVDARTHDLRREKERTEEAKHVIEGQAAELRSLNDHLEEQAEKLRDLNDNLQVKVQEQFELLVKERERYEADLIDAKDRAEASDRLKTAILNNLSHEFRTPLTAILGFTEIIAMEAPADLQEFTGEIERGGQRLLRTLDALLEFSRLEANESGLRLTTVDLTRTAAGVVKDLRKVAEHKDLPLHFKASAPVRSQLDQTAAEEIIWNLVDNAIKFTSEGDVEVSAGEEGGRAFVRVRDTGIGIAEDFRERMYEAFAQESDGFDRAFEGVGLGLTITKRLVEHLGGEIGLETEQGAGTTFTVFFPQNVTAQSPAHGNP